MVRASWPPAANARVPRGETQPARACAGRRWCQGVCRPAGPSVVDRSPFLADDASFDAVLTPLASACRKRPGSSTTPPRRPPPAEASPAGASRVGLSMHRVHGRRTRKRHRACWFRATRRSTTRCCLPAEMNGNVVTWARSRARRRFQAFGNLTLIGSWACSSTSTAGRMHWYFHTEAFSLFKLYPGHMLPAERLARVGRVSSRRSKSPCAQDVPDDRRSAAAVAMTLRAARRGARRRCDRRGEGGSTSDPAGGARAA